MLSKWKIALKGFDKYRFGEDKNLYRLPYSKDKRSYGLKKLKKNPTSNRWVLNGIPWTEDQLRPHLVLDNDPVVLFKDHDMPF